METKLVRVPFNVELAKKITEKSVYGKIVTRNGRNARIVCFDAHCDDNIVALIEDEKGVEYLKCYVSNGYTFLNGESDSDLMLEIPEYMTFKEGDILTCYGDYKWIFIYKESQYKTGCFIALDVKDGILDFNDYQHVLDDEDIKELRFATDFEKGLLEESLKNSNNEKAKEYLKRFFGIYSKYKDGDILRTYDNIVIIKNPYVDNKGRFIFKQYVGYSCKSHKLIDCDRYINQKTVRYATDEEKETIKRAIQESENPYYNYILKKYFREKQKYEFKPFDKVLVRGAAENSKWFADFFSHKKEDGVKYCCVGGYWEKCIPYNEQTAHLLGTTEDYKEE